MRCHWFWPLLIFHRLKDGFICTLILLCCKASSWLINLTFIWLRFSLLKQLYDDLFFQVAKESADVIILDDNFSTIVTVAKWGRSVYINIQKFVQFQLTVNVVALIVNFSSACLTGLYPCIFWHVELHYLSHFYLHQSLCIVCLYSCSIHASGNAPLTAVQLLWVNMIMDTLGALALATEPPQDDLMKREPVGRGGSFISNVMWRNIMGQSLYQFVVIWYLQTRGKWLFQLAGPDADLILNTLIFNTFVFCQVINSIWWSKGIHSMDFRHGGLFA